MADPASGESGGTGTPQTSSSEGLYVDSEELTFPKEVGLPPPQDSDFQAPGTACPTGMSLFAGAWAAGQSPSVICTGPWGYATSVPLWGSGAKGISRTSRTGCDWASRVGRGRQPQGGLDLEGLGGFPSGCALEHCPPGSREKATQYRTRGRSFQKLRMRPLPDFASLLLAGSDLSPVTVTDL